MPYKIAYPVQRTAAVLAVILALAPCGYAQDTTPPAVSPTAPKKMVPKAKAIPGQWAFAPESETSSKLAWQYTPGSSEFLALSISCDVTRKEAHVVVDLSTETQAKPSQRLSAKITRGGVILTVAGKVENGESGPFVHATVSSAQVAQLLDQTGDVIVLLPHHRLNLSAKTLPVPYASFKKACQLGEAR